MMLKGPEISTDAFPGVPVYYDQATAKGIVGKLFGLKHVSISGDQQTREADPLYRSQQILQKIQDDPSLLLRMPYFPKSNPYPRAALSNTSHAPLSSEERVEIANWSTIMGISNINQLYDPIDPTVFQMVVDIPPAMRQRFSYLVGFQGVILRDYLELLNERLNDELLEERLMRDAHACIRDYLPSGFMPQEETELLLDLRGTFGLPDGYYPKLRGKHTIAFSSIRHLSPQVNRENPFRNIHLSREMYDQYVLFVVHELAHQRHAELIGIKEFCGLDPDSVVSDEEYSSQSLRQCCMLVNEGISALDTPYANHVLVGMVREGFATVVELHVATAVRDRAQAIGDRAAVISMDKAIKWRLQYLNRVYQDQEISESPYTQGIQRIMRYFYNTYGIAALPVIIREIILSKCVTFPNDFQHPLVQAVLSNPEQLPGIAGNPIIQRLPKVK